MNITLFISNMADNLVVIKLVFMVFIGIVAFVAGMLPGKIPWCKRSVDILGIANAFSGGVFLSIAFLHILPEVAAAFDEFMDDHDHSGHPINWFRHGDEDEPFPLPFALAFVGYTLILLVDKVVFDTHSLHGDHGHGHEHSHEDGPKMVRGQRKKGEEYQQLVSTDHDCRARINDSEIIFDESCHVQTNHFMTKNHKFAARMSSALRPKSRMAKHTSQTFTQVDEGLESDQSDLFTDKTKVNLDGSEEDDNRIEISQPKPKCGCNLTPIVLMIALSAHSVFEGIATGLSKEVGNLWTFVIAIGAHKWAAAMSLGISMTKNFKNETTTMYVILTIFSLATPLGIGIGMLVATASEIVDIIFSSLAAGTFVYIACSEVIVEEFAAPKYKWIKMVTFILGAGLITVLSLFE